ncbi:D-glucuronyl C5-epimerase [Taenia crassiceps]|uniref:D-glucuronyl C5-epimerase n=1 Tax=Taenia crassiceps TaxID=6207 RepID=A0ABR4QA87_9CEST
MERFIICVFRNLSGFSHYAFVRARTIFISIYAAIGTKTIMRLNQRVCVVCISLACIPCLLQYFGLVGIIGWFRTIEEFGKNAHAFKVEDMFEPLMCSINGYTSPGCYRLKNSTIVVDFQHVKYWYEVNGYLNATGGVFFISNEGEQSTLPLVLRAHEPLGPYMGHSFSGIPEAKSRILLVDSEYNIPISRQWDPKGYPYPIQIAQFGLAYYGRYLTLQSWKPSPRAFSHPVVIDLKSQFANRMSCSKNNSRCSFGKKEGSVSQKLTGVNLSHSLTALIAMGVDWPRETRLIISVSLGASTRGRAQIHFACSDTYGEGSIAIKNNYWALGHSQSVDLKVVFFRRNCQKVLLLQNLDMVLRKAVDSINRAAKAKSAFSSLLLDSVLDEPMVVDGVELKYPQQSRDRNRPGVLQELLLFVPIRKESVEEVGSVRHLLMNIEFARQRFMAATEWLMRNQAQDGSWRIPAKHIFTHDIYLKPGWCSAMGQGQGISLLVRANYMTGEKSFLTAADRALAPFRRSVEQSQSSDEACGVRANFLGQSTLPWYEEYPVVPSVFVLNGFIYSLIGLYDLSKVASVNGTNNAIIARASQLLEDGVATLARVLPLYDSGTGSFYDLRHLSLAHAFRLSPHLESLKWSEQGVAKTKIQTLQALLKAGPNRARWQYHRVHLSQLHQLATAIAPQHADLWHIFFDRWLAYLWGFRSGHN